MRYDQNGFVKVQEDYASKFKKTWVSYLIVPEMYYEVAREGKVWPQNYTMEGLHKVSKMANKRRIKQKVLIKIVNWVVIRTQRYKGQGKKMN